MRVLFASHRYFPVPGGTERIAQLLAEGLVSRGHQATLITQLEPGTSPRESLHGVDVIRLKTRPIAGVRFPAGYLRLLRRTSADIFHVQGNRIWCADFYFPFAGRFRWRQMVTGHGFYQYAISPRRWDRWYFERYFPRVLRAFDYYVCDTDYERNQLIGWGVPPEKLPRISLGVDLEEFRVPTRSPEEVRADWGLRAPQIAVYAGGFFENKRVDRLIDAVAPVAGQWALVLLGRDIPDSPYNAAYCRRRAAQCGVELRILGAVPRPEVINAYHAADAIVNASEYEGFGVAIAESLAVGKPFVAWRSGAIPELAATGAGLSVGSVEDLTAGLRRLSDANTRSSMRLRSREAAPEWSSEAMFRRYMDVYERLAAAGSRR